MAERCAHGMLGRICAVESCPNWDGAKSSAIAIRTVRGQRRRRCIACGELKARGEFYADRDRPQGLRSTCRECDKARNGRDAE